MTDRIVIINADDLGYDPAVTRGILEAMREGVVTSTTFMVNMPYSEDAARAAKGLSIGLHLNLARHPPAWAKFPRALLGADGGFVEARAKELPADVVEQETLAQLDRLEQLLGRPATHVDVHKHLHQHAGILDGLIAAARQRGLPVRSITADMRARLRSAGVRTNDHFAGDAGATAYWTLPQLEADLPKLLPGTTDLMCHPGYRPETVKSGYSTQRETELETFKSPKARALLDAAGIRLADFTAVR